jgi:hypothetical protein
MGDEDEARAARARRDNSKGFAGVYVQGPSKADSTQVWSTASPKAKTSAKSKGQLRASAQVAAKVRPRPRPRPRPRSGAGH